MNKIYRMPNGRKYRFAEGQVPAGAVLIEKKKPVEEKAEKKPAPKKKAKAVKPSNKARAVKTK